MNYVRWAQLGEYDQDCALNKFPVGDPRHYVYELDEFDEVLGRRRLSAKQRREIDEISTNIWHLPSLMRRQLRGCVGYEHAYRIFKIWEAASYVPYHDRVVVWRQSTGNMMLFRFTQ